MEVDAVLSPDLADELPLSDVGSLPDELELDGSEIATSAEGVADLDELPLSQGTDAGAEPSQVAFVGASLGGTSGGEEAPSGLLVAQPRQPALDVKKRSILAGPGRPNKVLRDALARAMSDAPAGLPGAASASSSDAAVVAFIAGAPGVASHPVAAPTRKDIASTSVSVETQGALIPTPDSECAHRRPCSRH